MKMKKIYEIKDEMGMNDEDLAGSKEAAKN